MRVSAEARARVNSTSRGRPPFGHGDMPLSLPRFREHELVVLQHEDIPLPYFVGDGSDGSTKLVTSSAPETPAKMPESANRVLAPFRMPCACS